MNPIDHDCQVALSSYMTWILKSFQKYSRETTEFLSEHGRFWRCGTFADCLKGTERLCFSNSLAMAKRLEGELIYCEGYATAVQDQWPEHHAWCVTMDAEVVDFTWPDYGTAYFGIAFDPVFIRDWSDTDENLGILRPQNLQKLPPVGWKWEAKPSGDCTGAN